MNGQKEIYLHLSISRSGYCSRRKAQSLIREGKVRVNGKTVLLAQHKVIPEKDIVCINGQELHGREKKVYFLLNKPKGVLSSASDNRKRKTVVDLLPAGIKQRVYPVGRLDKDTTGLLILTNDGELTYRLTHPNFKVIKTYFVICLGKVQKEDALRLERGIELEGKRTLPGRIKNLNFQKSRNSTSFLMELSEGRKRQIKNMLLKIGHPVISLERIRYADLTLGRLKKGGIRPLTKKELDSLKEKAGLR